MSILIEGLTTFKQQYQTNRINICFNKKTFMRKIKKEDLKVSISHLDPSSTRSSTITKNELCDTNFDTCNTRVEAGCQSGNACGTQQHCETNAEDCNTKFCKTKDMGDGCLTMIENECPTFVGANCQEATKGVKCPTTTRGLNCDEETYPCISVGCPKPTEEYCENTDKSVKLCCLPFTNEGTDCIPQTKECEETVDICLIESNICHLSLKYCQPSEPIETTLCNRP